MRVVIGICFSFLLATLFGCRAEYVADRTAESSYNLVERVVSDSVFVHDSVFVRENADTVYLTRYRTQYRESLRRDTVVIRDTIYKQHTVTRTVQKGSSRCVWWPLLLPVLFLLWRVGGFDWLWQITKKKE